MVPDKNYVTVVTGLIGELPQNALSVSFLLLLSKVMDC